MKSRICSVLATLLMLALLACALLYTVPKLFGYQIYSVLTPSMTPALPVGCAVYVKACDPAALQAGDIVTYSREQAVIFLKPTVWFPTMWTVES